MIKNATQIRQEVNIVEVIEKFVQLKRRGLNYLGLCPFHNENSPSFTVFPGTNTFKCFGCGVGGDAVHFLMESQGLTFPEAIEAAASESRIEVEYEARERRQEDIDRAKQEQERRHALSETLHSVHRYYADHGPLPGIYCDLETKTEIVDADGRIIKRTTAEAFGICYTQPGNVLKQEGGWDESHLLQLGVMAKGDYGEYDFFRRRLLFRITDHRGKVVGLAGRRLSLDDAEAKKAKYINSPESILYQKSEILFGLYENRRGIRDAGFATLVEGYFDVVTAYDHGIRNHVAPCGTALTEQQANLLKRFTDKVLILRDGDQAGQDAAKRDVEILLAAGLQVEICRMTPPEELIKNIGQQRSAIQAQEKELREAGASTETEVAEKKRRIKADPIARAQQLLAGMRDNLVRLEGDLAAFKDPDAFIRRHNRTVFEYFLEDCKEDGLIWRVMSEYDADDVFKKDAATHLAANLISLLETESLREYYTRELCKSANLGSVKSILNSAVKQHQDSRRYKSDLTPSQKQDIINYGIYERDKKYFVASEVSGVGWAVSNFVVKPIIFIEGQRESIRLVEITNAQGIARILDINSRNFVELGPFKQSVEARGNFRFDGKPEHFAKVKAKVYDQMRTAFPIYTLGQHREGFFTYANGLVADGKFLPVDEFGLVAFGDTRYYLPAFSKIREHVKSDDVDNDYQDEQYYVYGDGQPSVSFKEWCELMVQVHGPNAIVGILYLCSCFIREKIFERLDNLFPHLNFFGLPGSGKNQLAASLTAWFGKYRPPVHIVNATDAAFFRRIAQVRNGLAWYDEYSNNVEHKRVEALKQFADGTGRSRAQIDNPNRTNSSQVNSGCIISGQQQPTADIALFTRCISLNFSSTEFSAESKERHARLKKIEQEGRLPAFAARLHHLRPQMLESFNLEFEATYKRFQELIYGSPVMDRIVRSYTAMLTTFRLLKEKLDFSFQEEEVEAVLVKSILTQKESVFQENETSIFWRMVEFFLANGDIEHDTDLLVEEVPDESFDLDWKGTKEQKDYRPAKRLLYLYMARVHPLYLERHQRQRNVKGLDMEALKYYLKASGSWEGFKRAKKFGHSVRQCLVFDADKLPFELEDTVAVRARRRRVQEEKGPDAEAIGEVATAPAPVEDPVDEKLPF